MLGDIGFMLGDCTVPALMLVLGGNLAKGVVAKVVGGGKGGAWSWLCALVHMCKHSVLSLVASNCLLRGGYFLCSNPTHWPLLPFIAAASLHFSVSPSPPLHLSLLPSAACPCSSHPCSTSAPSLVPHDRPTICLSSTLIPPPCSSQRLASRLPGTHIARPPDHRPFRRPFLGHIPAGPGMLCRPLLSPSLPVCHPLLLAPPPCVHVFKHHSPGIST